MRRADGNDKVREQDGEKDEKEGGEDIFRLFHGDIGQERTDDGDVMYLVRKGPPMCFDGYD